MTPIALTSIAACGGRSRCWAGGASASAQPALVWHAPASCPDEAALRAAIAERLDVPVERVELAAEIEVTANGQGFVARVTTHGEAGETRELSAASCTELTAAVAVVVARAAADAPAVAPVPPPPPPPAAVRVAVPAVPATRPSRWNAGARLGGVTGIGATPDLGIARRARGVGRAIDDAGLELAVERWATTTGNLRQRQWRLGRSDRRSTLRGGWFPRARPVRALGRRRARDSQRGTGFGFAMPTRGDGRMVSRSGVGGGVQRTGSRHISPRSSPARRSPRSSALTFVVDGATRRYTQARDSRSGPGSASEISLALTIS